MYRYSLYIKKIHSFCSTLYMYNGFGIVFTAVEVAMFTKGSVLNMAKADAVVKDVIG